MLYKAEMDFFDDGPAKPVRIWSRIGRRPIMAVGNSNGDIPMLRFAGGRRGRRCACSLLHDDAEREFDYTAGAEDALEPGDDQRLDGRQHQGRLDHGLRRRRAERRRRAAEPGDGASPDAAPSAE